MTLHFTHYESEIDAKAHHIEASSNDLLGTSGAYRKYLKRAFDILVTIVVAPIAIPVILAAAFLIAMDGHNPFYSQLRVGKGGKHFRMWKLRTMVVKADSLLDAHLASNAEAREEWNATQKLKRDPRVTLIGRLLRKSSMDELPQLLNVLNGTMSVVGPRPMMVDQQNAYLGTAYYRLQPGITGLWQVSDRNEVEFVSRVRYDDLYDRVCSLKTDLWVLMQTFVVIIRCTGY